LSDLALHMLKSIHHPLTIRRSHPHHLHTLPHHNLPTTRIFYFRLSVFLTSVARYSFPRIDVSMSSSDSSEFDQTSTDFLAWFASQPGTRLNPKIQLKDSRAQDAGRSAGKLASTGILAIH